MSAEGLNVLYGQRVQQLGLVALRQQRQPPPAQHEPLPLGPAVGAEVGGDGEQHRLTAEAAVLQRMEDDGGKGFMKHAGVRSASGRRARRQGATLQGTASGGATGRCGRKTRFRGGYLLQGSRKKTRRCGPRRLSAHGAFEVAPMLQLAILFSAPKNEGRAENCSPFGGLGFLGCFD